MCGVLVEHLSKFLGAVLHTKKSCIFNETEIYKFLIYLKKCKIVKNAHKTVWHNVQIYIYIYMYINKLQMHMHIYTCIHIFAILVRFMTLYITLSSAMFIAWEKGYWKLKTNFSKGDS